MAAQAEEAKQEVSTEEGPRRILFSVDGSESSERAIKYAGKNVLRDSDVVTLLHVRRHVDEMDFYSAESYKKEFEDQYLKDSLKILETSFNMLKAFIPNLLKDPERLSETGDAREKIVEVSNRIDASMVVMGSHGHGLLARAFLGSVSDYVLHHASCPVLVVRPGLKS